jgi:shikimate kinase
MLGYSFVDTDILLAERLGCTIAESVKKTGWQKFRGLERDLLLELSSTQNAVIATGGGAILHNQAWEQLRDGGYVVWLQAELPTLLQRLQNDGNTAGQRPSLGSGEMEEEIPNLLKEREKLYLKGSDVQCSTDRYTPQILAAILYAQLKTDC